MSQWFLFVGTTLTSIFLYALDNTIVANIVPVSLSQGGDSGTHFS